MITKPLVEFLDQVSTYLLVKAACFDIPVDLERLARHLGVIEIIDRPLSAEGYVEQRPEGHFRIVLRGDRKTNRKRFSLAHELGHIILHKLDRGPESAMGRRYRDCTKVATSLDEEALADHLAGLILLPSPIMASYLPRFFSIRKIINLADYARVSPSAALIRALGLSTQRAFAFHLRIYNADLSSICCKWVHGSPSLDSIGPNEAMRLLSENGIMEHIKESETERFVDFEGEQGELPRIQFHRRAFDDCELIYGFAEVAQRTRCNLLD